MPALFGLAWLALPLRTSRGARRGSPSGSLVLALVLARLGLQVSANFAKFAAVTTVGWIFLTLLRGALLGRAGRAADPAGSTPTRSGAGRRKTITEHHADVFTKLSIAFVVPGGSAARLGLPDVLFFAVFLAASARFGLRPLATWICMTVEPRRRRWR